jgi:hypothetical protein
VLRHRRGSTSYAALSSPWRLASAALTRRPGGALHGTYSHLLYRFCGLCGRCSEQFLNLGYEVRSEYLEQHVAEDNTIALTARLKYLTFQFGDTKLERLGGMAPQLGAWRKRLPKGSASQLDPEGCPAPPARSRRLEALPPRLHTPLLFRSEAVISTCTTGAATSGIRL